MENEEAADVIMLAISRLSYEQLQVMQALLDKHGHHLLADFVHVAAYNTSDPCPVGDDPESWQQQRSLLRAAPLESMKARRTQRMQKAKQAMGEHIWKVDQQRAVEVPAQMARASAFARSSMTGARQSMAAASKAAAQPAQPDRSAALGYPAEQRYPHTFTGLPPAFWQSEKGPSAAAALPSDPGNLQGSSGKGLSDLQDHRAHAGHPAKSATLGLLQEPVDAIIYAKVPGPWPAQGIRKS
ncbi:g9864 [Coccomyxa viridis]|uniref:G9864 protein n=1 Tax=Coccomyxa viridis TaxID=1274662 RepID=A0ABP1GAZ2_9CHLO